MYPGPMPTLGWGYVGRKIVFFKTKQERINFEQPRISTIAKF